MMIFDFRCESCDEVSEGFVSSSTKTIKCDCGGTANKIISPVRIKLDGTSGDFSSAHSQWAKKRAKEQARQAKLEG